MLSLPLTLKPCSPLSGRGEEEETFKDEWETTQILAEMAYPGTTSIRISPVWGVLFSTDGLSGFFASALSASLCIIQPWTCWGRSSSLPWLFCSSTHFSLLHLSVQLILSQEAPGDERRVVAVVLCCSPRSLYLLIFFHTVTPQPLKIWTS